MLSGTLNEVLQQLSSTLESYPRNTPGDLMIDGVKLHYADLHSFYHQAYQIFGTRLYEFESATQSPFIIDCGAHIGIASLFFKVRYPQSVIHAYEADPKVFSMLSANIKSFCLGDVTCHQKAVWIHNDGVTFSGEHNDSGSVTNNQSGKTIAVPSVRLKDILTLRPVDLLKVDIEGAEFETFIDSNLELRNVSNIICKVHLLSPNQKLHPLLAILDAAGFNYVLSDLHQALWITPNEKPPFTAAKTDRWLVTVFAWRR